MFHVFMFYDLCQALPSGIDDVSLHPIYRTMCVCVRVCVCAYFCLSVIQCSASIQDKPVASKSISHECMHACAPHVSFNHSVHPVLGSCALSWCSIGARCSLCDGCIYVVIHQHDEGARVASPSVLLPEGAQSTCW